MAIEAVDRDVQLAVGEPLEEGRVGVVEPLGRLAVPGRARRARATSRSRRDRPRPRRTATRRRRGRARGTPQAAGTAAARRAVPRSPASDPPCAFLRSGPSARRLTIAKRRAGVGRRGLRTRPCGYPCPVSGLRAIRARALRVLTLAIAGVAALAVGVAAGLGARPSARRVGLRRPDQRPGRAVERHADLAGGLVRVPRSRLGPVLHRGLGASAASARLRPQRRSRGVSLLGGLVTAGVDRVAQAYADGRKTPATGTFGGASAISSSPARPSRWRPAAQFDIPDIGWGAVDERRVVRSDGRLPRFRGRAPPASLDVDWHDLPAGTEILLGYADAAASAQAGAAARRGTSAGDAARARRVARARRRRPRPNPGLLGAPVVPAARRATARRPTRATASRRPASRRRRRAASRSTPPVDSGHAAAADSARATSSRSPAARTTATTSARRAPTRASTRASTSSRPRARRSWRCRRACCTTSAGTASAAGGCGSRTRTATGSTTRTSRPMRRSPRTARTSTRAT